MSLPDFARIFAKVKWEIEFGRPQRARETAHAWLGVIVANVMTGVDAYARAFWGHPYEPPSGFLIPAAPEIDISHFETGFRVTFLPAGSLLRFHNSWRTQVVEQLGEVDTEINEAERDVLKFVLQEDRVRVSWHTQCAPPSDGRYPEPFNTWYLKVDGSEHETCRVNSRLAAAFQTKEEARIWVETRMAELRAEHDRNHAKLCRDKACASRGHIYVQRFDDD